MEKQQLKTQTYSIIVDEVVFTLDGDDLNRHPDSKISKALIGNTPTGEPAKFDFLSHIKANVFSDKIVPIYKGSINAIIAIDEDDYPSFQLASELGLKVRVPLAAEMVLKSAENKSLICQELYNFIIDSNTVRRSKGVGMTCAHIYVAHTECPQIQAIMNDKEWVQNYRMNCCLDDKNLRADLIKRFSIEGIRLNIEHSEFNRSSKEIAFHGNCEWVIRWPNSLFGKDPISITVFILNWGFDENDSSSLNKNQDQECCVM